ncbi:unnamed protein product [Spirodela intermedia]|uniref:Uncharacterized protein n=1 Tax=Spirodela intermedia TaxID=51605 RepID=A0A7I8IMF8_SPIIN|nr:unnamed protein product [Spirodela intermedia]CAA6658949.1 unnamed protein product [Spirodela intermedia]
MVINWEEEVHLPLDLWKRSWPELVGYRGTAAAAIIEYQNPRVDAIIVKKGTIVTAEFLCDRVRVWVDEGGIVYRTPIIG